MIPVPHLLFNVVEGCGPCPKRSTQVAFPANPHLLSNVGLLLCGN